MIIKANHKTLLAKVKGFFASPNLYQAEFGCHQALSLGHGRIEKRTLWISHDMPARFTGFAGVRQLFRLEREVIFKKTGRVRSETTWGMTSLPPCAADPAQMNQIMRQHWCVENASHWVRDVTFGEDASRVRCGNLPQVMAALRNTCIGLIRRAGWSNVAAARRYYAAHPREAILLINTITITE